MKRIRDLLIIILLLYLFVGGLGIGATGFRELSVASRLKAPLEKTDVHVVGKEKSVCIHAGRSGLPVGCYLPKYEFTDTQEVVRQIVGFTECPGDCLLGTTDTITYSRNDPTAATDSLGTVWIDGVVSLSYPIFFGSLFFICLINIYLEFTRSPGRKNSL